jgi:hypothetical protein
LSRSSIPIDVEEEIPHEKEKHVVINKIPEQILHDKPNKIKNRSHNAQFIEEKTNDQKSYQQERNEVPSTCNRKMRLPLLFA